MATSAQQRPDAAELVERVQQLQDALDQAPDTPTRELADELVSAVVALYGEGLERVVARLGAESLIEDPLLCTLLLIHDLHPVPLADRVQAALDSVRPYMESHGGNVELLSVEDGVARIHLQGSCSDCAASSVTLELAIKNALEDAAPDLEGLEVEDAAPPPSTGITLPVIQARPGGDAPVPLWLTLDALERPADGTLTTVSAGGQALVVANVDDTLLAYRDACTACGTPLHDGVLIDGALRCGGCGRSYFLPRAGRSLDEQRLQLQPVPLLVEDDAVRVAIA